MEIDRKELKRLARERMAQPRPPFWVVGLLYILLTTGVNLLSNTIIDLVSPHSEGLDFTILFMALFTTLFTVVVDFGFNLWALWTHRQLDPGPGALAQGFSVAGRVVWMEILVLSRIFLWVILLILGFSSFVLVFSSLLTTFPILSVLVGLLLQGAVWAIMLRYALAPYLLADRPDDGASLAVRRSAALTRGWKWELFQVEFSFVGWLILSALLSLLGTGAALWLGGFFRELATLPADQWQELLAACLQLHSGVTLLTPELTAQQQSLFLSFVDLSTGMGALLLSNLFSLPLLVWLHPYRLVTRAGFYEARLKHQRESAPPV